MKHFFSELRRRNVYKVVITYAVVAWLLMQIASQLFPFFDIPNWAVRLVVLLLIIGFPVALILAWAFELTPQGVKRTNEIESTQRSPNRAWIYIVLVAGATSIGLFFLGRFTAGPGQRVSETAPEKSIAVLPFESLSEDKANAYFADGIQEEILARLSKIADLKVISRTSTQKYKSAPSNLRDIAQQLGVTNVLEGSVQKAADQVRISVQLVNALNDSHMWAETYDRKLIDIFEVESDVAQKIASSLEAKLTGREQRDIAVVGTKNPEAYDAFLHALALRNKQGLQIMEDVIGFSRRAVELDPNYAEAWAMLGIGEAQKYAFPDHSDAQLTRARKAAENALRLAPDSADGHFAMGMYYYYCLGDYDRALADLNIAHERAPNDANILLAIGLVQRRQGDLDQSITTFQKATRLDPLNQDVWISLARTYRGTRRFDEARAMFDRALTIEPGDLNIIAGNAETYLAEGDLDSAGRLLEGVEIPPNEILSADRFWAAQLDLLLYRRQFDEALAKLSADVAGAKNLPPIFQTILPTIIGSLHYAKGDRATARPLFQQTKRELRALREQSDTGLLPDAADALVEVGARLGERQEMEREAEALLKNAAKDAWRLPQSREVIARAYAILGDADRSVPFLEQLLKTPYNFSITRAKLRLDPVWDPIRDDPRFQKLVNGRQ
jgi:TolB-like protein/cytochrome c-type biogenesis protein CcmH/NrfG